MPLTQEMPYPETRTTKFASLFVGLMPMFLMMSFSITIPPLIKRIVHEKESGIKVRMAPKLLIPENLNRFKI